MYSERELNAYDLHSETGIIPAWLERFLVPDMAGRTYDIPVNGFGSTTYCSNAGHPSPHSPGISDESGPSWWAWRHEDGVVVYFVVAPARWMVIQLNGDNRAAPSTELIPAIEIGGDVRVLETFKRQSSLLVWIALNRPHWLGLDITPDDSWGDKLSALIDAQVERRSE